MKFLRAEEVIDILGVTLQTLKNWKKSSKIITRYLPGNYLYFDIDSKDAKGPTGHYLADHTMNNYYKGNKFNDMFMTYILLFDEFAQYQKYNRANIALRTYIEDENEKTFSRAVYIPERDIYVDWTEDLELAMYDSILGEFMKLIEVVGGYNMSLDASNPLNLNFSNRELDRYMMVGNNENTILEINIKYQNIGPETRYDKIEKIKDGILEGVKKIRKEGVDVWVIVSSRIWNLIKENVERVDILQIREGLKFGMNCERSVRRVGKLDEGVYIYENSMDKTSGRVLIGNRIIRTDNRKKEDGAILKYDYRLVWRISRLIGTRAEVKLRYDMDVIGEEGWKNYYMMDIEIGEEEELEGDEVSLDENAMKMEIISRIVGLMDKRELNILLNRLRRRGVGK